MRFSKLVSLLRILAASKLHKALASEDSSRLQFSMGEETGSESVSLYFGYGSNLWLHQMRIRCPNSTYIGMARLNGYRWIIGPRRYANVIEMEPDSDDVTWGMAYTLTREDEERLDLNEGVPIAYTKEILSVDFWSSHGKKKWVNVTDESLMEGRKMLVYIDRTRTTEDEPWDEYIYRMNMGIKDARELGMPKTYVDKVLRRFIPEEEDESAKEKAHSQAAEFEDEANVKADLGHVAVIQQS